jgi:AcrR family transcriptional regulator
LPGISCERAFHDFQNLNKREQIIESAANCFLQRGFSEVSLDDIASHGDVVKQTIYNYFDDKEALFNQTVEHLLSKHSVDLPRQWYQLNPEAFFLAVGKLQAKTLIEPGITDFLRLLVKECRRFPELQVLYARSIPTPMIEFIAGYLEQSSAVAATVRKDQQRSFAIAWSFRAAIAGYATMLNLGPLVPYSLPPKARYLKVLAKIYADFVKRPQGTSDNANSKDLILSLVDEDDEKSGFKNFLSGVKSEKKLDILFAALKTFSVHGFSEASMDQVAVLSSGSKQTIYKHFVSKRFLFVALFESIMAGLETVSFPDYQEVQSNYLADYSASLFGTTNRSWMREYFRLLLGESQSFAKESGRLLVYLMDHGRTPLASYIKRLPKGDSETLCKSIAMRCILGSFILLRQVYVLGQTPFIDGTTLLYVMNGILDS